MNYTLANLEKNYELELDVILERIKGLEIRNQKLEEKGGISVLLQLPDGLKPWGLVICDYLEREAGVEISIWLGACFGACDLPDSDTDLVVQFGHAEW